MTLLQLLIFLIIYLQNERIVFAKVVVGVFAGRRQYVTVLARHLRTLIERKFIDEVHFWDFTKNNKDLQFLLKICRHRQYFHFYRWSLDSRYSVVNESWEGILSIRPNDILRNAKEYITRPVPQDDWSGCQDERSDPYMFGWTTYYRYYAYHYPFQVADVFIKCDDDIVFIDTDKFPIFLAQLSPHSLNFPNIVNNDVGALFQTLRGVHNLLPLNEILRENLLYSAQRPLTTWDNCWCANFEKGRDVHLSFLNNRTAYSLLNGTERWGGRISINFFAGKAFTIQRYFREYTNSSCNDEAFLTVFTLRRGFPAHAIILDLTVVHMWYSGQTRNNSNSNNSNNKVRLELLQRYHRIAFPNNHGNNNLLLMNDTTIVT